MDRAERNALVEKNIGLVHACANKFRGKGAEYDDLFQAGCVGIIKAAENFDPERYIEHAIATPGLTMAES